MKEIRCRLVEVKGVSRQVWSDLVSSLSLKWFWITLVVNERNSNTGKNTGDNCVNITAE